MINTSVGAIVRIAAASLLLCASSVACASAIYRYEQSGYELTIEDQTHQLSPALLDWLRSIYFETYPQMAARFNPDAPRSVRLVLESTWLHPAQAAAIAEASKSLISIRTEVLQETPGDIDLEVHELMHLVQHYPSRGEPTWLVEGIADFARSEYGVADGAAAQMGWLANGWQLPDYRPGQNYDDSYRVTARFLLWIENRGCRSAVEALDRTLRADRYSASSWKQLTGRSVEDWWSLYSTISMRSPALP